MEPARKAKVKFDIILAVPGMAFNGDTFEKRSVGGSESAGYYMGRALAARGHRVTVFCGTESTEHGHKLGICTYMMPLEQFLREARA